MQSLAQTLLLMVAQRNDSHGITSPRLGWFKCGFPWYTSRDVQVAKRTGFAGAAGVAINGKLAMNIGNDKT